MRTSLRPTALLAATTLAALLLAGCSALSPETSADPAPSSDAGTNAEHALVAGLDPVEIVDTLESLPVADRPSDLIVSVRPASIVITDAAGEREEPLPDDLFYLSVAPYAETTHDCFFHSLTTCRGELGGQRVEVTVVSSDGTTLIDEERVAADDGFVGLWLPRDISGTLTVTVDGRAASTPFATGADDPTCLTTMRVV